MVEDPSQSRKALSEAVKGKVQEEDDTERLAQLTKLEKQGQMVTSVDGDEAKAWANTIQSLLSQLMPFTLKDTKHSIMPLVVPAKLSGCPAAIQHMNQGLPFTTECAGT